MLTKTERKRATVFAVGLAVVGLTASFAAGASVQRSIDQPQLTAQAIALSSTDPVRTSPVIPRCISDDFNDGTQALCYTVTVDDEIVVIDATDTVVSVDVP
jgi:hypothetical protein